MLPGRLLRELVVTELVGDLPQLLPWKTLVAFDATVLVVATVLQLCQPVNLGLCSWGTSLGQAVRDQRRQPPGLRDFQSCEVIVRRGLER